MLQHTSAGRQAIKPGRLSIDGQGRGCISGQTIDVRNPATGEGLTTVERGDAADVDLAVKAARRAFEGGPWAEINGSDRSKLLWRIGDLIIQHLEELAVLESLNTGKTLRGARSGDMKPAADIFYYYAGWARNIHGEVIPVDGSYLNYTLREPVGVVGMITAWNTPCCWRPGRWLRRWRRVAPA
jgi:acyl-CoA reductase-like NAD-dependent aldehyde dehydrogenase